MQVVRCSKRGDTYERTNEPMPIKPYPSNIIIFNIDERVLDEDMKLALKRSWTHIGEILIRSHVGSEDSTPRNFIHVMVKYGTRKYLRNSNENSLENWTERLEQHLLSTMRKISNNNIAFNRRQRECGNPELKFDAMEFELEAGALTLEYRLDSNGTLPVSCADIATEVRDALNAETLGEPVRVIIPSKRFFEEQVLAHEEVKAAQAAFDDSENGEEIFVEEEDGLSEAHIEEPFIESPELIEELAQEEAETSGDSPFEIAPLTEEEWEAKYGTPTADFEIDYHIWEIEYPDGSTREFNSQTKLFIL